MSVQLLHAGERVIHPVYGFGVVEGMSTRDQAGQAMDYYNVRLSAGSMLTVPVSRAESLGLRLIVNSLASIRANGAGRSCARPVEPPAH